MRHAWIPTVLLFFLAACGGTEGGGEPEETGHGAHEGKHGGELDVLGSEEAHFEVKIDHDTGTIEVWFYDADVKPCAPDAAPVLNLMTAAGPKSLTAVRADEGWRFQDDVLKAEPESGRFAFAIGGKPYTPDLEHHDEE